MKTAVIKRLRQETGASLQDCIDALSRDLSFNQQGEITQLDDYYMTWIVENDECGFMSLWDENNDVVKYAFGAWNGQLPEWAIKANKKLAQEYA